MNRQPKVRDNRHKPRAVPLRPPATVGTRAPLEPAAGSVTGPGTLPMAGSVAGSRTGCRRPRGPVPPQAADRGFTPVRPGFVAPCMVEAARRTRRPDGRFRGSVPGSGGPVPALTAVPAMGTAGPRHDRTVVRARGRIGGATRHKDRLLSEGRVAKMGGTQVRRMRGSENRQREYSAECGAGPRADLPAMRWSPRGGAQTVGTCN